MNFPEQSNCMNFPEQSNCMNFTCMSILIELTKLFVWISFFISPKSEHDTNKWVKFCPANKFIWPEGLMSSNSVWRPIVCRLLILNSIMSAAWLHLIQSKWLTCTHSGLVLLESNIRLTITELRPMILSQIVKIELMNSIYPPFFIHSEPNVIHTSDCWHEKNLTNKASLESTGLHWSLSKKINYL